MPCELWVFQYTSILTSANPKTQELSINGMAVETPLHGRNGLLAIAVRDASNHLPLPPRHQILPIVLYHNILGVFNIRGGGVA